MLLAQRTLNAFCTGQGARSAVSLRLAYFNNEIGPGANIKIPLDLREASPKGSVSKSSPTSCLVREFLQEDEVRRRYQDCS